MTEPKTIVFFDFDDTLCKGDSFWPFLVRVAGKGFASIAFAAALVAWKRRTDFEIDFRTFIKQELIWRLLNGVNIADLAPAIHSLKQWQCDLPLVDKLREHKAKGHHVVIATGSLSLYMPDLLKNIPHDALLCTEVGVSHGIVSGEMTNGNCVRERKAELVAAYLEKHGPFDLSWAYGNYPHDVPMMMKVQRRILV